ncbi:MAG: hypothetical protein JNM63_12240 [Spirochaetia bacterium]|nr:hypothetical protein [Spirochaetia bacterium]
MILSGLAISLAFTAVISLTAAHLTQFKIIGKTVPFAYPWRLSEPTFWTHLTAWTGYILHNLSVWAILFFARREKPGFSSELRWFNWSLIGVNVGFAILHILQTRYWYDGLAADVPEITALGSVALMLMVILIFETPRRGLILGKKFAFREGFVKIIKQYHGYLFSWAIIYTFWYHPTEGTLGHLVGYFYMFMLFVQSALVFNRAHVNRLWTFTLEFFVLFHGLVVALLQGGALWPMFVFGFGAMLVLTQMYGLGLGTWTKRWIAVIFIVSAVAAYSLMGRLPKIHEIARIPVLDYAVVFVLYLIYLGAVAIGNLLQRRIKN